MALLREEEKNQGRGGGMLSETEEEITSLFRVFGPGESREC